MNKDIIHYFKQKEPIVIGYYFMQNDLFIAPLSQIGRSSNNDGFYCNPVIVINQQGTMVENIPYAWRDTSKIHLYLIEERNIRYNILENYLTKDSREISNKIRDLLIPENKIVFQGSSLVREFNNQVVVRFKDISKRTTNLLNPTNRPNLSNTNYRNIGIFKASEEAYIVFDENALKSRNSSYYEIYDRCVKVVPCENIELNPPLNFCGEYASITTTDEWLQSNIIYEKIERIYNTQMYKKTLFTDYKPKFSNYDNLISTTNSDMPKIAIPDIHMKPMLFDGSTPSTKNITITKLSSKNKKSTKITIKPILKIK